MQVIIHRYILHSPRPCNTWVVRVFTACRWCTWSEKSAPFLIHINSVSIIMSAFWNKTFYSLLMTAGFTIDEKQFVFVRKKHLVDDQLYPWSKPPRTLEASFDKIHHWLSTRYKVSMIQFTRVTSLCLNLLKNLFWFLVFVGIYFNTLLH